VPASPPTNIDLEINETCSLETMNTIYQTAPATGGGGGSNNNNKNQNTNTKNSCSNSIETQHHQKKSQLLIQQTSSHRTQTPSNSDLNNNNNQILNREQIASKNKNSKIETCFDKWYTQLKGHVLVMFLCSLAYE
jgi:hypothetical protein